MHILVSSITPPRALNSVLPDMRVSVHAHKESKTEGHQTFLTNVENPQPVEIEGSLSHSAAAAALSECTHLSVFMTVTISSS